MAFDGKRPVTTAAFFAEDGWISPAHFWRRVGGGRNRRARDAAAQGCRWLTVETAEEKWEKPAPSYRNMVRAGFRVAYSRPNYLYRLGAE